MFDINSRSNNRITAYMMAFFVVFFALCTALFMAIEAGHRDCHDEHCAICTIIHQCENTLRQQSGDVNGNMFVILPVVFFAVLFFVSSGDITVKTPISQKVRLND
ncbi:MAG: hypothetical protein K6F90_05430 [Lachnospiraceae bacterium]|nr:hypothetical protein [Lachnospiraceae bacterium]